MTRTSTNLRLRTCLTALALLLSACGGGASDPTEPSPAEPSTPTPAPVTGNPFDGLYAADFRLQPLAADAIAPAAKPPRAQGLHDAFIDPAYGTRLYRATAASEGRKTYLRHDYSRRQAFNADNTRYLARDGEGYWHLYDANTFQHVRELPGFAGACEPLWHPTDAHTVYLTSSNGGMVWWAQNVETGAREVLFDFTGQTPWPQARAFWTRYEGSMSADGRYLALMATAYNAQTQENTVYGLLMLDVQERRIVGTLDAAEFPVPHAMPDHISTSPSGRWAVPSREVL